MNKSYYITTPIYYVNDSPHIGHAYTTVAADVMARFKRLQGYEVKFLTGTDEHGQKVDKAAKKAGIDAQKFTDEVSLRFRNLVHSGENLLNVTNDDFIRTTESRHKKAAQELWKRIYDNGHIYQGTYEGWYSVRDEAYYQESELIDGKAPSGSEVEWVEERSYFFDLSKWQEKLLAFYEQNPDFIAPKSRYNEVVSFVRGGKELVLGALKDLSISRTTFDWGVPVPGDEEHVMYVWIDALTNYLTATGFPDTDDDSYQKFWVNAEASPIHLVGKDILRFHAVYWPAFLMAADLPLPKRIFAHGWWTIEGEKMSKSVGNVIAPSELVDDYGVDQMRYFLMKEVPFGNDGNFSKQAMTNLINADLANEIGNLAQRVLSMIKKNCSGCVPDAGEEAFTGKLEDSKNALLGKVTEFMDKQAFNKAIEAIIAHSALANNEISKQQPWQLKKEGNISQMNRVLYELAENIRYIAILLTPFTPEASKKLLDQMAIPDGERSFKYLHSDFALKPGTELPEPQGVFPRFVNQ